MKAELYRHMPESDYRGLDAVSQSDLKQLLKSPKHFDWAKQNPMEPTPAMQLGTDFHTLLLEPAKFSATYAVGPVNNKRLKAWKDFAENETTKTLITPEYYELISQMKKSCEGHPIITALIESGEREISAVWQDEKTKVLCKGRADLACPDLKTIVDFKTTTDASMQEFKRKIVNFFYELQGAFYLDGFSKAYDKVFENYVFVVIETKAPFDVAVYRLNDASLEVGQKIRDELLRRYKNRKELDYGYARELVDIGLASYGFDIDSRLGN